MTDNTQTAETAQPAPAAAPLDDHAAYRAARAEGRDPFAETKLLPGETPAQAETKSGDTAALAETGTDRSASGDDATENEPGEGETAEKPKRTGWWNERIYREAEGKRLAQRERDEALAELQTLKAQQSQASTEKPEEGKFESYAEYVEALTDWKVEQKLRDAQVKQAKAAEEEAHKAESTARSKHFAADCEAVKSSGKYADFETVAFSDKLRINDAVQDQLLASDKPADVLYYLGSHLDEAEALLKLSPSAVARAMGRIEERLALTKPVRTQTSASPPITPVSGPTSKTFNPDKATDEEYREARMSGKYK